MIYTGKTALITGASRGIGKSIALKFAEKGANVAVAYIGDEQEAADTLAEIRALGVEAELYRCDVSNFNAVKACCDEVLKRFNKVDVLVNNAGITADTLLLRMSEEQWDRVVDVNLKGAFNFIKHLASSMLKNRDGAIVNMASVVGLMGNAGQINYAASKAGLIGLTKSVAREFAPRGITCNAVAPGFINSAMTAMLTPDQAEAICKNIPLGRTGETSDVAEAVLFLASNRYITGEVLKVDGGMYI